MQKINLTAQNDTDKILLDYLQENASEMLAEKINNGVTVNVDGKVLTNKKNLQGCMQYCCEQARKIDGVTKSVGLVDTIVFGWVMHYFEEDSIHGDLYNQDGTLYKKEVIVPKANVVTSKPVVKKEPNAQMSIFDTPEQDVEPEYVEDKQTNNAEMQELNEGSKQVAEIAQRHANVNPSYQLYCKVQLEYLGYILLQRLGDFYEAFDDSAKKMANALDLTLTSKDVGLTERVALAGVPYHALDKYVAMLIDKGYRVVLLEDSNAKVVNDNLTLDIVTGEVTTPQTKNEVNGNVDTEYIQYLLDTIPDLEIQL